MGFLHFRGMLQVRSLHWLYLWPGMLKCRARQWSAASGLPDWPAASSWLSCGGLWVQGKLASLSAAAGRLQGDQAVWAWLTSCEDYHVCTSWCDGLNYRGAARAAIARHAVPVSGRCAVMAR